MIDELAPDGGDRHEVGVGDVGVRVHHQRHIPRTRQELVPSRYMYRIINLFN